MKQSDCAFLYMVEVFDIIAAYGVNCHCYADDMQVYASVPVSYTHLTLPTNREV